MRLLTIAIGWMFAMTVGAVELTDTIGAQEHPVRHDTTFYYSTYFLYASSSMHCDVSSS